MCANATRGICVCVNEREREKERGQGKNKKGYNSNRDEGQRKVRGKSVYGDLPRHQQPNYEIFIRAQDFSEERRRLRGPYLPVLICAH